MRLYEIGTGELAFEIKSLFRITSLSFSSDGEFLAIGGKNGKISIWGLKDEILDSVKDVYHALQINPFFWKDYPIIIENDKPLQQQVEENEQDTLDLSLIQPKNQANVVSSRKPNLERLVSKYGQAYKE